MEAGCNMSINNYADYHIKRASLTKKKSVLFSESGKSQTTLINIWSYFEHWFTGYSVPCEAVLVIIKRMETIRISCVE